MSNVLHCGLSGEVCEEPVVCKASGQVYEKRVILKYLEAEGKDPASGEEITAEDLVPVKSSKVVRPRPVAATSLPGLLALFQNEWDALMLETFTLKQHLDTTRQELAQALYQHDAACRVIARLVKERDQAINTLNAVQSQLAQRAVASMDVDETPTSNGAAPVTSPNTPVGLSEAALRSITEKAEILSKGRKKRPVPEGLTPPAVVQSWQEQSSYALHKTDKPGVFSLDILPANQNLVVTGGADKEAVVFDRSTEQVVSKLRGHGKKVNAVLFHPSGLVVTGSGDKTVKLWRDGGKGYSETASLAVHADEVTSLSLHATNGFFASCSRDKSWAFFDIDRAQTVLAVADPALGAFEALSFHPDGILLGTASSDNTVRMWDLKSQQNVHAFEEHTGAVKAISFSENGYYMASGSADNTVRVWDLRKLRCLKTLEGPQNSPVEAVAFDLSGQYLAAGGNGSCVWVVKEWNVVTQHTSHSDKVTAVKFGYPNSSFLATTSMDRTLKFYTAPQ